jgi:HEAT repeat protein
MSKDVQALLDGLKQRDWAARLEAVRQLELSGDPKGAPGLIGALKDESQFVRAAAARALGRIGGDDAVPALVEALGDGSFHVQQAALWALGDVGAAAETALPALEAFTKRSERFPQAELTVAEQADLTIKRINKAVEAARAPAAEEGSADAGASGGVLTPEERKAKREAAMARKKAQATGGEAAPPAAEQASGGTLTPEERKAKREAAMARKRAKEQGEG